MSIERSCIPQPKSILIPRIKSRTHCAALLAGWLALTSAPAHAAEPGLVGYWRMEEGIGASTADLSGNGLTGLFENVGTWGGPAWTNSPVGNFALNFDGVNDRITLGNPPALQFTGPMTLAAWINVRNFQNGRILSKSGNSSGQGGWSLNVETGNGSTVPYNSGAFQIASSGSSVIWVTTVGAIPATQWIHLCGVYEPGVAMRIYTNGYLNNVRTTGVPAAQFNSTLNVSIGGRSATTSGNPQTPFNGMIDEVRAYDRVLSAAEILALADRTPRAPFFLAEPVSQTVIVPAPVTFTAAVSGQPPLALQWLSNGVAIAGATNIWWAIPVTYTNLSGTLVAVRVTNALGSVTSSNAVLTALNALPKVEDTKFTVDRGFFSDVFSLAAWPDGAGSARWKNRTILFPLSSPDGGRTIDRRSIASPRSPNLDPPAKVKPAAEVSFDSQTRV